MEVSEDTPEMDMERMCRSCMTDVGEMKSVFLSDTTLGESLPRITDMLMSFTSVQVLEDDGLPGQICNQCSQQVSSAYTFKLLCERSDAAYRNYTRKNNTNKIKEESPTTDSQEYSDFSIKPKIELTEFEEKIDTDNFENVESEENNTNKRQHSCDVCQKTFTEARYLKRHMSSHATEDLDEFECKYCDKIFNKKDVLQKHMKKCQKDEVTMDIKNSSATVTKTKSSKPSQECSECGSKFARKQNLVRHLQLHHNNDSSPSSPRDGVSPSRDSDSEIKSEDLPNVEVILTEEEKKFKCKICSKEFAKQKSYAAHMTKHIDPATRGQKEFPCTVCQKVFNRRKNLTQHLLTHETTKANKCDLCYRTFSRPDQLALHMNNHTGQKRHVCPHCSKGFNMLSTLKDHLRTHSGEKPFLCSICGKGFSQNTNLKQHVMRHNQTKPFKCTTCGYSFVSKGELDAHLRKHTGDHPFVCDICGTGFTTSSSLVKHKRIHSGEKPYACEFCPMRFTALGTLKNHRRTHTGEKPYACTFCERAFAQKSDLVSHTRTHTGERPYVCGVCGHAFQQSSALKTHSKMHVSAAVAQTPPIPVVPPSSSVQVIPYLVQN